MVMFFLIIIIIRQPCLRSELKGRVVVKLKQATAQTEERTLNHYSDRCLTKMV